MRKMFTVLALVVASAPALASAEFNISSMTGVNYIDNTDGAITDFDQGELESNSAYVIKEGVGSHGSFYVDHDGTPGTYSDFTELSSTTLGPGVYGSYLVHFDPIGQPSTSVHAEGSVTFDINTRIVGLAILPGAMSGVGSFPNTLKETDAIFGPGYDYYDTNTWRGLELGGVKIPDGFSISADGRTFSFDSETLGLNAKGLGIDEVRLILQAVPEVSSIVAWSMVAGLGLFAWRFNNRRKTLPASANN